MTTIKQISRPDGIWTEFTDCDGVPLYISQEGKFGAYLPNSKTFDVRASKAALIAQIRATGVLVDAMLIGEPGYQPQHIKLARADVGQHGWDLKFYTPDKKMHKAHTYEATVYVYDAEQFAEAQAIYEEYQLLRARRSLLIQRMNGMTMPLFKQLKEQGRRAMAPPPAPVDQVDGPTT